MKGCDTMDGEKSAIRRRMWGQAGIVSRQLLEDYSSQWEDDDFDANEEDGRQYQEYQDRARMDTQHGQEMEQEMVGGVCREENAAACMHAYVVGNGAYMQDISNPTTTIKQRSMDPEETLKDAMPEDQNSKMDKGLHAIQGLEVLQGAITADKLVAVENLREKRMDYGRIRPPKGSAAAFKYGKVIISNDSASSDVIDMGEHSGSEHDDGCTPRNLNNAVKNVSSLGKLGLSTLGAVTKKDFVSAHEPIRMDDGARVISPDGKIFPVKDFSAFNRVQKDSLCPDQGKIIPLQLSIEPTQPPPRNLESYLAHGICEMMKRRGMRREMYEWQAECLTMHKGILLNDTNLLVTAPTSAGKTLVAEVLMLRALKEDAKQRKILFVLPYVTLCKEKADRLEHLVEPLGRQVKRAFGGSYSGSLLADETGIIVCTIENANSLVNKILEANLVLKEQFCCVVVDELHLVGQGHRGALLELLLTKLVYHTRKPAKTPETSQTSQIQTSLPSTFPTADGLDPSRLQIVGMTATCPNIRNLAAWLDALAFISDYRPVPLKEYIKDGCSIRAKTSSGTLVKVRDLPPPRHGDLDHIGFLAIETIRANKSVMIFCATKKSCVDECRRLCKYLKECESELGQQVEYAEITTQREKLASHLKHTDLPSSQELSRSVLNGVAFHHGDLTQSEREWIEGGFMSGVVRVLCCTSTLGAGVNLPVYRVIFKHAYKATPRPENFLKPSDYRQISGRAGRAGIDESGESILIASKTCGVPHSHLEHLILSSDEVISSELTDSDENMRKMMLEMVATGSAASPSEVIEYLKSTLGYQSCHTVEEARQIETSAREALAWLGNVQLQETSGVPKSDTNAMIMWSTKESKFKATEFGRAVVAAGLSPEEALEVRSDLKQAMQSFVFSSDLHACFLCVPININFTMSNENWRRLYGIIDNFKWNGPDDKICKLVGVQKSYCQGRMHGHSKINQIQERICQRFYMALLLQDLIQDIPKKDCILKFGVSGREVERLQEDSSRFAANSKAFCARLNLTAMAAVLEEFGSRIWLGARSEIVSLAKACNVSREDAKLLFSASLEKPEDVAAAEVHDITKALAAWQGSSIPIDSDKLPMYIAKAKAIQKSAMSYVMDQSAEVLPMMRNMNQDGTATGSHAQTPSKRTHGDSSTKVKAESNTTPKSSDHDVKKSRKLASCLKCGVERYLKGIEAIRAGDMVGLHLNIDEDKKKVINPEMNMPAPPVKRRKISNLQSVPSAKGLGFSANLKGIGIGWKFGSMYVQLDELNGELRRDVIGDIMHAFFQRRLVDKDANTIAAIGWKNESSYFGKLLREYSEDPIGIEALRVIDVRIAVWMLDPDSPVVAEGTGISTGKRTKTSMGVESTPRSLFNASEKILEHLKLLAQARLSQTGSNEGLSHATHLDDHLSARIARNSYEILVTALPLLTRESQMGPLMNVEMPICCLLGKMELHGVGLDKEYLMNLRVKMASLVNEIEKTARQVANKKFDLSSPKQVEQVLYGHLHIEPPECAIRVRHGNDGSKRRTLSTDKEALHAIVHKHEVIQLILDSRKLRDSLGYINSLFGMSSTAPSHPTIHAKELQTCCASGRVAMEEPNLQSLPNPYKIQSCGRELTVNVRKAIIPTRSGRIILSADYRHIELRLMAHLSGDKTLCSLLREKQADPFKLLARNWMKIPDEVEVDDAQRQQVKALTYGLCYGMGSKRLAEDLGVSELKARKLKDDFLDSYPGLSCWIKDVIEKCRANGYINTLHGRRRWLPDITSQSASHRAAAERAGVNTVCQGSAADLVKSAMLKIEAEIKSSFTSEQEYPCAPLFQVHDELVYEVDNTQVSAVVDIMRRCMEGAASLSVPLMVKFSSGKSWGEMEEI